MSAPDPPRPELSRWLEAARPGARVVALAGDASSRRFWRVAPPSGASRVVMDYGQPFTGETDDVRLNRIFTEAGLRVPRIEAVAGEPGCLELEDLGDVLLETRWEERPDEQAELLDRAVLLAADVAERGTPVLARSARAAGPVLDAARFRFEMDYFLRHFVSTALEITPNDSLEEALGELARAAADSPRLVLCHRDFHSRNLMVLPDGELAMVDIQDARWGPDAYDLASFLRDAYIPVPEDWVEPAIQRYLDRLADAPEAAAFRDRFEVVAAQRMIKALGTFGYQVAVLGRRRYASAVPRVIERLRRALPRNPRTQAVYRELSSARVL